MPGIFVRESAYFLNKAPEYQKNVKIFVNPELPDDIFVSSIRHLLDSPHLTELPIQFEA